MISPSKMQRSRQTKKGMRPKSECALVFALEMFTHPAWSPRDLRLFAERTVALWKMTSSSSKFVELFGDYWQLLLHTGHFSSIDSFLKWRAQAQRQHRLPINLLNEPSLHGGEDTAA